MFKNTTNCLQRLPSIRSVIVLAVVLILSLANVLHGYDLPVPKVDKICTPKVIDAGDWSNCVIRIDGESKKQNVHVPTAIVFTLDYSGSMGKPDNNYLKVAEAAKQSINKLVQGVDMVAVIKFADVADASVTLTAQDFAAVKNKIDTLSPGGATNIYDGFLKGNKELLSAPNLANYDKRIILMTDGYPTKKIVSEPVVEEDGKQEKIEPDPSQITIIQNDIKTLNTLVANGIKYYCVVFVKQGVDPAQYKFLKDLSTVTMGDYCEATNINQVVSCITEFVEDSQKLSVSNINIKEVVNQKLRIRTGSFIPDYPNAKTDADKFKLKALMPAINNFYKTNQITFPEISTLESIEGVGNEVFLFSFDVTHDTSGKNPKKFPVDDQTPGQTNITYEVPPVVSTPQDVPSADLYDSIIVRPEGVYPKKEFDEATNTMTLEVKNTYRVPVIDIHVYEKMASKFKPIQPVVPTATSSSLIHGGELYWMHNKIEPNRKLIFRFGVDTTNAVGAGPFPMNNIEGTRVRFTSFDLKATISESDPHFSALKNDMKNKALSSATVKFLKNEIPEIKNLPSAAHFPGDFEVAENNNPDVPFQWYIKDVTHHEHWAGSVWLDLWITHNLETSSDEFKIYLRNPYDFELFNQVDFYPLAP